MTEREVKNGNSFKDHVPDQLLGKKDSDRLGGILTSGLEKRVSSFHILPEKTRISEKDDSTSVIGISTEKFEPQEASNFNEYKGLRHGRKIEDLSQISEKTNKTKDFRNFKSMTIDRMGKMFKPKSQNVKSRRSESLEKKSERDENIETRTFLSPHNSQSSRKEKANSLGRMLKLMDKDIKPKRMFSPSIFKSSNSSKKSQSTEQGTPKSDDTLRRAFSRILSQIKGRSKSENTPAEPNIRTSEEKSRDFHSSRAPLASRIICSLSSSQSRLSPIKKSTPLTHDPTSSTSGIP